MNDAITVRKEESIDIVYKIMKEFNEIFTKLGYQFDDIYLKNYAIKILSKGMFISAYYKENNIGFFCGYLNLEEKCAYVSFWAVKEEYGILKGLVFASLINAGMDILEKNKIVRVNFEVRNDNVKARKIYEKIGFSYGNAASENSVYMEMEYSKLSKYVNSILRRHLGKSKEVNC